MVPPYHPSSTLVLLVHFCVVLVISVVDSLTSENMDNKETERIMEDDVSSKEKSDSPDEETSKEESPQQDMSEVCVNRDVLECRIA